MKDMCRERVVLQFAKWPEQGKVKTRMQPDLSQAQSLRLHRRLLSYCFRQLFQSGTWAYELCIANGDKILASWSIEKICSNLNLVGEGEGEGEEITEDITELQLLGQADGDLGEKMRSAAQRALSSYQHVVIVGSDCPFVNADYIEQAFCDLEQGADVVIGPASDGGYVLLAFSVDMLESGLDLLFDEMPWSHESLCQNTIERIQTAGLQYKLLATLSDIDRPEDLDLLNHIDVKQAWY